MALSIKKGDLVSVLTGKDVRQKKKRVLEVIRDARGRAVKVLVEDVNTVTRHTRPSQKQQGGRVTREAPIDVSNVMLVDPKTDKMSRFGAQISQEGVKIRVSKKSGSPL